jgi:CRP-like cAMP-binding protein/tRNA A-37 threonylcarbamoyl transferase component Bud32
MSERFQNCWEFMGCGREPGGKKCAERGVCPASDDRSFDGINFGKNAGRICWAVAGTFCGGKTQGTFAEKRESCVQCDFFQRVSEEQGTEHAPEKFLSYLSDHAKRPILGDLKFKFVKAGERFITQGEVRDCAYIINRGSGLVVVEKNGELHPVGHRGRGDIVGVVQILTGEPQHAHVEAETDMELWVLKREQFEDISRRDPEFLDFVTEIIADRFDSKRPMADRAIGKYVATDIIGRGGYSIVYKGIHKGLNMPVAIKMMRHNLVMKEDFLTSFHNEARIIASLNHKNIVKVYDIEERFRTVFIIMELLEGESLKEMINRLGKIPPLVAANFLAQICSGLHYAHEHGILHLDINPTNVLVQRDDQLKILDFGVACHQGADDRSLFDGTIFYMAPEQMECKPVDQRTDIYSLAITAYELVTGRRPFAEDSTKTVIDEHLTRDVPDPKDLVPNLPEALRRFILKAGRRDPSQRYQSAEEASEALRPLIRDAVAAPSGGEYQSHRMTTLFLVYRDEHRVALKGLVEQFSAKAKELGIDLKVGDLKDA